MILSVQLPDDVLSALGRSPREVEREIRLLAAVHWYARGRVSQGKAAEIAGLTRAGFIDALSRAAVDAVQVDLEELREEIDLP